MNTEITSYKDLLTLETLDVDKVKSLLKSHIALQQHTSQVYKYVTKGLLTSHKHPADMVINLVKAIQRDTISKNVVREDMITLAGGDEFLTNNIKEYFSD